MQHLIYDRIKEQEEERVARRLEQIWLPGGETRYSFDDQEQFEFSGQIEENTGIFVTQDPGTWGFFLQTQNEFGAWYPVLGARTEEGLLEMDLEPKKAALAIQWRDYFRRGCWFCGCAIEATDLEKAKWRQDFSCEELHAWNLTDRDAKVDKGAQRIAAAFGLQKWGRRESKEERYRGRFPRFCGVDASGVEVIWRVSPLSNDWSYIYSHLIDQQGGYVELTRSVTGMSMSDSSMSSQLKEFMGRGFYRLDLEGILPSFDYFPSAHEKMELRLSMPREFWP